MVPSAARDELAGPFAADDDRRAATSAAAEPPPAARALVELGDPRERQVLHGRAD